jgi:predicted secreted protein
MKSLIFFGIIYVIILPLLAIACDKSTPTETIFPPTTPAAAIDLTLGDFSVEKNIVKDIEIKYPGTFTVRLGSNGSTGYEWGEAIISDLEIIAKPLTNEEPPKDTKLVGEPGAQTWIFKAVKTGTATIKLSYSRPWTGGEKDTYTLTINVTVK